MHVYYFGCKNIAGHHLHRPSGVQCSERSLPENFPCRLSSLDEGFLPPFSNKIEGLATLAHLNGWTILSFPDYSVDRRPGSNSTFVLEGYYSFNDTISLSRENFAWVWERYKFKISERLI